MYLIKIIFLSVFCLSIFQFNAQNPNNTTVEFAVFDSITKEPLSKVEVTIVGTNGIMLNKFTDSKGEVVFSNQEHKELFIEGIKYVFLFHKEDYIYGEYKFFDYKVGHHKIEVLMKAISSHCELTLTVLFEKNKNNLTQENNNGFLNLVNDLMKNDPQKVLKIYGNSDCNESRKLANKRAKACYEYFVKSGIDKNRLHIVPFDKNNIKFASNEGDSNEIDESTFKYLRRVDFELVNESKDNTEISSKKVKVFDFELLVFDKETKNPIPNAKVTFTKSDGLEIISNTDNSGKVFFENVISNDTSLSQRNFSYAVYKKEYFSAKHESTYSKETINFKDTVFLEYALGKIFRVPEVIFWDSRLFVDEYNNSYDSIMKLHQLLIDNPTMVIELQFNTDCRGSVKYNEKLTQRRADGVKYYLVSKGIESARIIAKGNGLSNPILGLDCESIKKIPTKEEQEKAHQKNRRTEFKVVSFDFKPLPKNQMFSVYQEIIVLDKESGKPIENAQVGFFKNGSVTPRSPDFVSYSNTEGKVVFEELLSSDILNFSYTIRKDGYLLFQKDNVLSNGKNSITDTVCLLNVESKVLDLPQIWFAYDKKDLLVQEGRVNSYDSLDYLYQILIDNPSIIVELQCHTDCRGSNKYSRILTQIRAQSCVDYLISKGISKERLVAKGYEGTVHRKTGLDCESINKMPTKEEQEKAHQQNRRVQFRVLSFDYKPKVDFDINDVPKVQNGFD